jgi:hypothetical protein
MQAAGASAAEIRSWERLREKVGELVKERGVLLAHPRDEYDVLEERLLEALELQGQRVGHCGHFLGGPRRAGSESEETETDEDERRHDDRCEDCGRACRNGLNGVGSSDGTRFRIRVYAANGLMKAGAWAAAWREMERVDVEIEPWVRVDVARELERLREEEERIRAEEEDERNAAAAAAAAAAADAHHVDEMNFHEHAYPSPPQSPMPAAQTHLEPESTLPQSQQREQLPLMDLLIAYIKHASRDSKNITIALLSVLVLFLALRVGSGTRGDVVSVLEPRHIGQEITMTPIEVPQTTYDMASTSKVSMMEEAPSAVAEKVVAAAAG